MITTSLIIFEPSMTDASFKAIPAEPCRLRDDALSVHHFEHETALQSSAHAKQPGIFNLQPQGSRLLHRHRLDLGQKTGAAENQPAGIKTTEPPGLLADADLAHFDPAAEASGEIPHKFTEIDAIIRERQARRLLSKISGEDERRSFNRPLSSGWSRARMHSPAALHHG